MKISEFIRQQVPSKTSQSAFARKCKVSQSFVNNVLQGHESVSLDVTSKIATAYGLPLSYFLDGSDIVCEQGNSYCADRLSPDIQAIVDMVKDDPELARRVRRYTTFEKSAQVDEEAA